MMAGFIMAGRIQAAIFVIVSTLVSLMLPPMLVFSNAAIALITLRKGWQQGIIYSLLATATLMIVSVVIKQDLSGGFIAGLVTWLPILFIASVLALTSSWSKTLQLILLIAVVGVLLFHFLFPDAAAFWVQLLEPIKPLLKQSYQFTDAKIDESINIASAWMTGTFAATFALLTIISLMIARNWQAQLYNPGGFGEEFRQIRIGKQASIGLLIGIALAVFTNNQMITELIMVAIAIFMFQGLSVAHSLVKQRGMGSGWLIALYALMFILLIQMIVLLATIGLIDNFVDFRQKQASKK
jgi:hypothetical protein